jgi:hypothetical protein
MSGVPSGTGSYRLPDDAWRERRIRVPRIDQHGEVVYFIDVDARRWRVYDVSLAPPTMPAYGLTIHCAGSQAAAARVFVPPNPDAPRYMYHFRPSDAHDLTIDLLYRQLLTATPFCRSVDTRRGPRDRAGLREMANIEDMGQ